MKIILLINEYVKGKDFLMQPTNNSEGLLDIVNFSGMIFSSLSSFIIPERYL